MTILKQMQTAMEFEIKIAKSKRAIFMIELIDEFKAYVLTQMASHQGVITDYPEFTKQCLTRFLKDR